MDRGRRRDWDRRLFGAADRRVVCGRACAVGSHVRIRRGKGEGIEEKLGKVVRADATAASVGRE